MARPADRKNSCELIRKAAVALFKARGYHGTSVRDLAKAARIETASIYYYFPSKQEILLDLCERIMDALYESLVQAIRSNPTPEEQLRAAIRAHVLAHTTRQDETFISHSELRLLLAQKNR